MPTRIAWTVIACAAAVLAFPLPAGAKEPTKVAVDGPGLDVTILGAELARVARQAGVAPAMFGHRNPDPLLRDRPAGDLGPRYTATYTIWGASGDPVVQEVYPYATPPLTYMAPGQEFHTGMKTYGGWFKAGPALKETLVAAGLPSVAPPSDDSNTSFGAVGVAGFVLLAIAGAAVVARRRLRRATR